MHDVFLSPQLSSRTKAKKEAMPPISKHLIISQRGTGLIPQKKILGKRSKEIANILIHEIAPNYENRNGGYTRIIKVKNRKNDNALVSLIEFIDLAPEIVKSDELNEKEKGDSKK